MTQSHSASVMQIILPKKAFVLVKTDAGCVYDYDLVIKQSYLHNLECPHCGQRLAFSGYYLRQVITDDGKKITIRIPRLQCGNHECIYKLSNNLSSPPIVKVIPYFIRKHCRHLLINILVSALLPPSNKMLRKVFFKFLSKGETEYPLELSDRAVSNITSRCKNLKLKSELMLYILMSSDWIDITVFNVKNSIFCIKNCMPTFKQIPFKIKEIIKRVKFGATRPTDFVNSIKEQLVL